MKRSVFFLPVVVCISLSCTQTSQKNAGGETLPEQESVATQDMKNLSFEELFQPVQPSELPDNVFKLVGEDFTVITAGQEEDFNSMTASWGGWGRLFELPSTWCFLRASRYTLELIKREQSYTMSYFADEYKDQVLYFGSKSGRDSDKMKNNPLTFVKTPAGNITYREARLVIECKLMEITTVAPGDFYSEKGKTFVEDAFKEVKEYHKLVFGEISHVWIKKQAER
ncbi:MAG: flavin reductase [Bacteroidales bacterium]|jgi:flavin reductase (DIM6/NTAB) family NADH-FMN oxidoreductase RutF|nr:flavin reductase [Bacteroidales bacterium]